MKTLSNGIRLIGAHYNPLMKAAVKYDKIKQTEIKTEELNKFLAATERKLEKVVESKRKTTVKYDELLEVEEEWSRAKTDMENNRTQETEDYFNKIEEDYYFIKTQLEVLVKNFADTEARLGSINALEEKIEGIKRAIVRNNFNKEKLSK